GSEAGDLPRPKPESAADTEIHQDQPRIGGSRLRLANEQGFEWRAVAEFVHIFESSASAPCPVCMCEVG
ncbi:hypothetical protein, partial [Arthrobacter sp. UYCo732]|uniref:hypothetical protein n=1 Tax=Arthrobacter sp. UYCo732 TaxID=3156336 RepID=UPI003396552F